MDRKNLLLGVRWKPAIKKAIQRSDVVLVFLSRASVKKRGFFQKELNYVLEKREEMLDEDNYLIPIRLDDCKVPEKLSDYQWLDWFAEEKKDIKRLAQDIRKGLKRRQQ